MTVTVLVLVFFHWSFFVLIKATENVPICDRTLEQGLSSGKLQRIRALCQQFEAFVPEFDLTQIDSGDEAEQILRRVRRARGGRGGGGRFGRSSSGRVRFLGSRSSSGGSRIFSRASARSSFASSSGHRPIVRTLMRKPSMTDKTRSIKLTPSSGGSLWVRSGKQFLPHAARFGVRYYQRRKYNQGLYRGMPYGMTSRTGPHYVYFGGYYHRNYGYPPADRQAPLQVNGTAPTVFYCLQEDLNRTLVNRTLNDEGLGVCNVSGKLVQCPMEIECQMSEADNCCEDAQGTPYCCGGPIPVEYRSHAGGYGDDWKDAGARLESTLNLLTALLILIATGCFTIWQRHDG